MSISLAEALQQVKLEPGKTYRCKTREHVIEVRVLERHEQLFALPEADIMLDSWVALPHPTVCDTSISTYKGELDLPDPPDIPDEEPSDVR